MVFINLILKEVRIMYLLRVTNNLIDHTSEKEIKDFVLNYLLDIDDISRYIIILRTK